MNKNVNGMNENISENVSEKTELNADAENANIELPETIAGNSSPEDAMEGYKRLIESQNETISALIEQNRKMTENMANLVRSTPVSVADDAMVEDVETSTPDDYEPLAELGKMIGSK